MHPVVYKWKRQRSGSSPFAFQWLSAILSNHSPLCDSSWKPFRMANEGGGGGGGAPEPGLSGGGGGGGGTGPPLCLSNPPLEGSCGVAASAREVLPFLFNGGGGGRRGPTDNKQGRKQS